MKPCAECGRPKTLEIDPADPDSLMLWEAHTSGCSWSPCITPAERINRWRMRKVPRTDSPTKERE